MNYAKDDTHPNSPDHEDECEHAYWEGEEDERGKTLEGECPDCGEWITVKLDRYGNIIYPD